nr:PepSY domain-containing protein [Aminobacter carboxidus]
MILSAAILAATGLCAQAQTQPSTDGQTPAIATPDSTNPTAPVAGANSFTEAQAKAKIEEAGFQNVSALVKAESGIWQGKATKDGKEVVVSLDYQGNVVAQ